jgi:phosphatidylserine decarboxylase
MTQSPQWWQSCLPKQALSWIAGRLAQCRWAWFKNWAIRRFAAHFGVNWREALHETPQDYPHFNAFFTRALKPGVRPLSTLPFAVTSPVDGCISEFGYLAKGQLLQAKGRYYQLSRLLAEDLDNDWLHSFGDKPAFMTAYLSPRDYHRIHMPLDGRLRRMVYVPGKLFSVNQASVAHIDQLFARNERVICYFDGAAGPFILVLVGAMIVGSIATHWHGVVNAPRGGLITQWDYENQGIALAQGDEMGHFQLGSTVIMLMPSAVQWRDDLQPGSPLRYGEYVGMSH